MPNFLAFGAGLALEAALALATALALRFVVGVGSQEGHSVAGTQRQIAWAVYGPCDQQTKFIVLQTNLKSVYAVWMSLWGLQKMVSYRPLK